MMVKRIEHKIDGPAKMMIVFRTDGTQKDVPPTPASSSSSSSSSAAPQHSSADNTAPTSASAVTKTIHMQFKQESEILSQLMEYTRAVQVEPTEDELRQLRELEEKKKVAMEDRERNLIRDAKARREEALLAQARGNTITVM